MKGLWYAVALLVIRFTMELIVRESVPQWANYDMTQRTMVMGLLVVFTILAVCVAVLGISDIRRTRIEGVCIRY